MASADIGGAAPSNPQYQFTTREAFRRLYETESASMAAESYTTNEENAHHEFRRFALSLIKKHSRSRPFDVVVPYLAMNYFDRFVSRFDVPPVAKRNLTLFVICCLTLAWKTRTKYFKLSSFLRSIRRFKFKRSDVLIMEMHICSALQWRLRSVTPLCFVNYFINLNRRFLPNFPDALSVCKLIVRSQAHIQFTGYRPSVLAASAVLIVASKEFFLQYQAIELTVPGSDFREDNREALENCVVELGKLYKPPLPLSLSPRAAAKPPLQPAPTTLVRDPVRGKAPVEDNAADENDDSPKQVHDIDYTIDIELDWEIPDGPDLDESLNESSNDMVAGCCWGGLCEVLHSLCLLPY